MLPALPLIAVSIAAAAAGWAGASWWAKLQGGRDDPSIGPAGSHGRRPGRRPAQALTRCPGCQTWFVAAEAHGCDQPDCPLRPAG